MNRLATFAIALVLLVTANAGAQTRSRKTTRRNVPAKTTTSDAAASAAKLKGATTVANQIKNLTTFLYLLGGVAKEIEALDAAAKSGQTSPTNERNKAQLKASFEDFRVGLDQLELTFRTTPELQPYYTKIVGSASGAADAEAQAGAGHFIQAGRTLIGVVGRLSDVLVAMGWG
jgi:hypothetical protein